MGASGKKGAKETEDRVVEPREVDILCGRGGLSNHHPGNEWYRRLIRSNRPLYRACPKHTKLLVSKAIVQAVEQQGGRFLERSRKDGFWYPVPYKRAVDKTSQGLRERERDDDEGAGGGAPMAVPHQFSGQGAPHKLSDLADVAIAHATRMDGLPRSASELIGASGGHQQQQQQQQHHRPAAMAASVAHRATAPHARAAAPLPRSAPPPLPPPQQQQQQRLETKDLSPLPPTLEPRQSSMFRLLKDTKLLPAESAFIMGPNAPQHGAVGGAYAKEAPAAARATAMPVMYGVSPAPPYAAAAAGYAPAATNGAPAPTLTRLTSQVSDWLNSFWPVPVRGESTMAAPVPGSGVYPPRAAPPPPAGYGATPAPPPPKGVTPPIVTIPPPEPQGPIQINTIPPMKNKPPTYTNGTAEADKKKSNTVAASSLFANMPIAKPIISSHDTKRPSQQHQARTNENRADNKANGDAATTTAAASGERPSLAPTELESSVSATLLKLASTPSRFFSGISALFGDEVGQDDNAAMSSTLSSTATLAPNNNQVVVDGPPIVAGTKRSKASLLDDDDSSGDEAAAAVVPNKRRRTSLLDDYQESTREARMRNVYD